MKKLFTILIAAILIASGMNVSVDRHYCGGTLADVKISVTGKLASCGMEQPASSCDNHPSYGRKCCEDQMSYLTVSSNYCPSSTLLPDHFTGKVTFAFQQPFMLNNLHDPDLTWFLFPPGNNPLPELSGPRIRVLRI